MKPGDAVGQFTLEARIGRGGGGEVWRASDASMGRRVALKFPAGNEEELERFRREARIGASLEHPNIAAVYGVGEHDGRPYIAMQLVEGTTLEALRGKDARRSAAAVRDAAKGVQFAHDAGVIHRDLKPGNVMITPAGRVTVMDFGLARPVGSGSTMTASGMLVGTPAYMGPEQARGEAVGARSDVYGLGATLYDLLAGRPPFDGADLASLLMRVIDEAPPRLACDSELEAIVMKCLEKEPSRRYGSARELGEDLDRWLAGEAVTARRSMRMGRKTRRVIGATVAIVAVAAATFGVTTWKVRSDARSLRMAEQELVERMRRTSDACLLAALDLRRSGDLVAMRKQAGEVEIACREVMRRMPRLAEPHTRLGRVYRALMREADALREQEAALEKEPGLTPAILERLYLVAERLRMRLNESQAIALAEAGARLAEARRLPTSAELIFRDEVAGGLRDRLVADATVLERSSEVGAGERAVVRGLVALFGGELPKAMEHLAEAERHAPEIEQVYAMAASIETARRNAPAADAWYTRGLERDRGYVPFWINRGLLRMNRALAGEPGMAERSLEDLDTAVRLDPGRADGWFQRGHARMRRLTLAWEDAIFDGALADAAEAARLQPAWAEPWITRTLLHTNLAIERERRGEDPAPALDVANEAAEEALRREPAAARPSWARGRVRSLRASEIHRRGGDAGEAYRLALEDYDRSIAKNPAEPDGWTARGLAQYGRGQADHRAGRPAAAGFESALSDFDQALKLSPRDARTWWRRADASAALARVRVESGAELSAFDDALRDIARSIQLDDTDPNAFESAGTTRVMRADAIIARGGDALPLLREAVADFERAAGMAGAGFEGRVRLARARLQLGVMGGARIELERTAQAADGLVRERPSLEDGRLIRANATVGLAKAGGPGAEALLEAAAADVKEARRLNPRRDELPVLEAGLHSIRGHLERDRGADGSEEFASGARILEEAVARSPRDARLLMLLAGALVDLGAELLRLGRDPAESCRRAVKAGEESLRLQPWRATVILDLGHARRNWAQSLAEHQGDGTALFASAVADYEKAATALPGNGDALKGHATALLNWGTNVEDRGGDPLDLYRRAIESSDRAVAADGSSASAWRVRGHAAFNRARLLMPAGKPYREDLKTAKESYENSLAADPSQESKLKPLIEACRRRLE